MDFLHEADFNITNIQSNVISQAISDETMKFFLEDANTPQEEKERIKKERTIRQIRTIFEHTIETEEGNGFDFDFSNSEKLLLPMIMYERYLFRDFSYLKTYNGALLFVSHDRYFLDKVVNKIVLLTKRGIEIYFGNYTYFIEESENRLTLEFKKYKDKQKIYNSLVFVKKI